MTKCIFLLLLFFSNGLYAQPADFILLKKKNKTIHSYYSGSQIEFVTTDGVYKNALINKIAHDTIFLQEYLARTVQTGLGFYVTDTAGSFRYAYDYHQIKIIGKKEKGFNVRGSGNALLGGGIILTLASGVVYLADREKFSPALMIASAGLGLVGFLMTRSGSKGMVIGKNNYRLEYLNMSSNK